jgi:NAD(P)-dependent dehydrogenase (short-subunit alcohol dehydrogenase family)
MSGRLSGKVVIVTGGAQGVGRGIAMAMAREGATLVIADLNEAKAQSVVQEIEALGQKALAVGCNVTRREDADAVVARTVAAFGQLDVLVNNAQGAPKEPLSLMEHTDKVIDLCFDTGYRGSFYFMQAAYPHLKKRGGRVINIASGAGLEGMSGFAAYGAAKEAIRALSKTAAREWGRDGINVNILCPLAKSPGIAAFLENAPEMEARITAGNPIPRIGDCETDIGPAAVFLASEDSRYITGHTLPADGGATMIR